MKFQIDKSAFRIASALSAGLIVFGIIVGILTGKEFEARYIWKILLNFFVGTLVVYFLIVVSPYKKE